MIAERVKMLRYKNTDVTHYFWRTTQQQEIDLIEEQEDKLEAFEFKWSETEKVRFPQTFTENYPKALTKIISPENVEEFIGM